MHKTIRFEDIIETVDLIHFFICEKELPVHEVYCALHILRYCLEKKYDFKIDEEQLKEFCDRWFIVNKSRTSKLEIVKFKEKLKD